MAEKEEKGVETSEAEIAVHWQEEGLVYPSVKVYCPGQHDR